MSPTKYTADFKEQALIKVLSRGSKTIGMIAEDLSMSQSTLKHWMHEMPKPTQSSTDHSVKRPADWSMRERLWALQQSHELKDEALHAWCRQQGIFEHHLVQWHADFCSAGDVKPSGASSSELRTLKQEVTRLERQLTRKDKALAEAAALIVLHRNFQALLGEKAD